MMNSFLGNENEYFPELTREEYNKELDDAMERMDSVQFISIEELEKEMSQWKSSKI